MTGFGWLDTLVSYLITAVIVILLVGGFVGMIYYLASLVTATRDNTERLVRVVAVLIAFLAYFGASRLGLSIPSFLLQSLEVMNPILYGAFFGAVAALAGFFVARFMIGRMRASTEIAARVTIFIGVLIIAMFLDLFVKSVAVNFNAATMAPNLFFVVGLGAYLVFVWEPSRPSSTPTGSAPSRHLRP